MALAKNPNLKQQTSTARLKSAVVNTASTDLQGDIHVTDVGAGKLNAADAVNVAATLDPAAISFGPITTVPVNRTLTVTNVSGAARDLHHHRAATHQRFQRASYRNARAASPCLRGRAASRLLFRSPAASLRPAHTKASSTSKARGPDLHLPYSYVVGSGVPYDIFRHAERLLHRRPQ